MFTGIIFMGHGVYAEKDLSKSQVPCVSVLRLYAETCHTRIKWKDIFMTIIISTPLHVGFQFLEPDPGLYPWIMPGDSGSPDSCLALVPKFLKTTLPLSTKHKTAIIL